MTTPSNPPKYPDASLQPDEMSESDLDAVSGGAIISGGGINTSPTLRSTSSSTSGATGSGGSSGSTDPVQQSMDYFNAVYANAMANGKLTVIK